MFGVAFPLDKVLGFTVSDALVEDLFDFIFNVVFDFDGRGRRLLTSGERGRLAVRLE